MLSLATEFVTVTGDVEALALSFEAQGLHSLDTLHLAVFSNSGMSLKRSQLGVNRRTG
jgi:hypothetical protein